MYILCCFHKVSTRVESLPEHSAICKFAISPRTANVFHHSRNEICLRRCLFIRLFVYDLTSKHVPNRWVIRCTNKLSIWLCTANDSHDNWVTVPNNLINNVGERGCWIFWRNDISIFGKLSFGKMSFRRKVRSAKSPFGKMSVRRNVRRQNVRSAKCLSAKCLSAKCLLAKCPGTIIQYDMYCYVHAI
jgi:hypothetical protein